MNWLCQYCNTSYNSYEPHSCPPYSIGPEYTQQPLDLGLTPPVQPNPTVEVYENFQMDTLDVRLYLPHYNMKFGCRITRDFIMMTPLNALYSKLCELFDDAIKIDPRVRATLRQMVLGEPFSNTAASGVSYTTDPYYGATKTQIGRSPEIDLFPGIKEKVKYPAKFYEGLTVTLEDAIVKLNDMDGWSREQIADWLETLDIDIRFKTKDEEIGS